MWHVRHCLSNVAIGFFFFSSLARNLTYCFFLWRHPTIQIAKYILNVLKGLELVPQIGTWIQGVTWLRREEVESRRLRRYRKASYKVLGVGHWGRARSTGIEMASLQWRHSYLSVLELVSQGKVHRYSMPFPYLDSQDLTSAQSHDWKNMVNFWWKQKSWQTEE